MRNRLETHTEWYTQLHRYTDNGSGARWSAVGEQRGVRQVPRYTHTLTQKSRSTLAGGRPPRPTTPRRRGASPRCHQTLIHIMADIRPVLCPTS